jgi:GntR family transcriptional regulator, carbon starvation induced regulator
LHKYGQFAHELARFRANAESMKVAGMRALTNSVATMPRPSRAEDLASDELRTFAQAVQSRLAEDILNGRLAPGIRLRLQSLCETYQVSMSPLREALSGLAGRRLVTQDGQRGFRVASASTDDLRDITETRIHVETLALRLSIAKGGDDWEASILAAHHRFGRKPRSDDLLVDPAWEELHRSYHVALISACGLPRLLDFYRALSDDFDRYRRLAVVTAGRHPRPKSAHGAIVKAALARDAPRAEKILGNHVRDSAAQILTLFGTKDLARLWPART